ncbi:MAG: seg [Parcubacteria group bacterium]|nr:seg [Parcubacteria group bacterium]
MDPLARLIGSPYRLKLLRLFFFNDDTAFSSADAAFRSRTPKDAVRKELSVLLAAGIIKKRSGKQGMGYAADKRFRHYFQLQEFLRTTTDISDADMLTALKKAGTIRLVALSGMFTGVLEAKVDMLIVGDKLEEKPLTSAIRFLEAELGRELRYASFTTEEFRYRLGVYDRLLRDIFDYPHRMIVDRLGMTKS